MNIIYKIPNNYKSNCLKKLGLGSWIYCLEDLLAIVENDILGDVAKENEVGKNDERNKATNVFKNTWSYNSFAGANDTKIQNIIGKDVEPHNCWYWTKSISFHWFINFSFFLVELILLIFECRFETFNMFFPLFFPIHHKHEIKNQTRQYNSNFNCLLHSKPQNLILSPLSLSFSLIHL